MKSNIFKKYKFMLFMNDKDNPRRYHLAIPFPSRSLARKEMKRDWKYWLCSEDPSFVKAGIGKNYAFQTYRNPDNGSVSCDEWRIKESTPLDIAMFVLKDARDIVLDCIHDIRYGIVRLFRGENRKHFDSGKI